MWPLNGIKDRLEAESYSSLTEAEQGCCALMMMVADVCNGGFRQYFYNYTGDYAHEASRMLARIGGPLKDVRDALERAMAVLPSPYSSDNAKRQGQLEVLGEDDLAVLETLEQIIFDYSTDVVVELQEWASEHEDEFPT